MTCLAHGGVGFEFNKELIEEALLVGVSEEKPNVALGLHSRVRVRARVRVRRSFEASTYSSPRRETSRSMSSNTVSKKMS